MVQLFSQPVLSSSLLKAFHCTDPLLSNSGVIVLYGSAATYTTKGNGQSRIQAHVFSIAGLQSFQRLLISPGSPLYDAVNCLERTDQGDEVCRILAYSLNKYFTELPCGLKEAWTSGWESPGRSSSTPQLFTPSHAAYLASRMVWVQHAAPIVDQLQSAFEPQHVTFLDVDLQLPTSSLVEQASGLGPGAEDRAVSAKYLPLISLLDPRIYPSRKEPVSATFEQSKGTRVSDQDLAQKYANSVGELLATEENYVSRLATTLEQIWSIPVEAVENTTSTRGHIDAFDSLHRELQRLHWAHSGFLDSCRGVMSCQGEPAPEIEGEIERETSERSKGPQNSSTPFATADKIADLFQTWIPRWTPVYEEYFGFYAASMQAIRSAVTQSDTGYGSRIRQFGEQRFMSVLIEPIQRIPRYVLLLKTIVEHLPSQHRSIETFLRMISVLDRTCAAGSSSNSATSPVRLLRTRITDLSHTLSIAGRFIGATVLTQVPWTNNTASEGTSCKLVGVLFTDALLLLAGGLSEASGLQEVVEDLEKLLNHVDGKALPLHAPYKDIRIKQCIPLKNVRITNTDSHLIVHVAPSRESRDSYPDDMLARTQVETGFQQLKFSTPLREQTKLLGQTIVRARLEGRLTETRWGRNEWHLHETELGPDLEIITAVFDDERLPSSNSAASCKIYVDTFDPQLLVCDDVKDTTSMIISICTLSKNQYTVETFLRKECKSHDVSSLSQLLPLLYRRITALLQFQYQERFKSCPNQVLQQNEEILKSLKMSVAATGRQSTATRSVRPHSRSPVKSLAQLFLSSTSREAHGGLSINSSRACLPQISLDERDESHTVVTSHTCEIEKAVIQHTMPKQMLEEVFEAFVTVLRARKGNIVGKSISERRHANANDISNLIVSFMANPCDYEKAAQEQVSVLFAAFDNFLGIQWKDEFGDILPARLLKELQTESQESSATHQKALLSVTTERLQAPNNWALATTISLTVELLSEMGNDSDRGALVAGMTEMLVRDELAVECIPFIDQLIEDHAQRTLPERPLNRSTSHKDAGLEPLEEEKAFNTAPTKSFSLSKRLGLANLRPENTKVDQPNKAGVFRTWSKNTRTQGTCRPLLDRTHSVDTPAGHAFRRPRSQEGSFTSRNSYAKTLDIADAPSELGSDSKQRTPDRHLNRKRRSSLPDLEALPIPNTSPLWGLEAVAREFGGPSRSPLNSSQNVCSEKGRSMDSGTVSRLEFSVEAPMSHSIHAHNETSGSVKTVSVNPPLSLSSRDSLSAQASSCTMDLHNPEPVLEMGSRGILTEHMSSSNARKTRPSPNVFSKGFDAEPVGPTNCERISGEDLAGQNEEIARVKDRMSDELMSFRQTLPKPMERLDGSVNDSVSLAKDLVPGTAQDVANRLEALEVRIGLELERLSAKVTATLSRKSAPDVAEASVVNSYEPLESTMKDYEQQLRRKNAEIEALYKRSNEELQKTFGAVKDGNGVEELKRKLRQSHTEASRLRRENERLRRKAFH